MLGGESTKASWEYFKSCNKGNSEHHLSLDYRKDHILLTQFSCFGFLADKTASVAPRDC